MAKRLFLTADTDSVTLSDAGFTVFGGTGNQTVKLTSAATGATLDANIERVELSGNLSAYTFKAVSGTGLQIYSGSTLVGTIGSLNQNATVAFADGSAALLQTGATTFTLGGQTVTTSATAAAITGATVNAADKSTVAVTIPTFSVTAGAATATEDGNATFTVSLNQAQLAATTVTLALTGTGGATIGTDTGTMTASGATLAGNVLTFAAGSTSAVITVPVTWDAITETTEGLSLALSAPTGVTGIVASSTAATVALADSATPTFTLTSNTVAGTPTQEGGSIVFTITPSGVVDKTTVLTVNLAGAEVGAITTKAAADDFSAAQTVTFLAGDKAARTTSISVTADSSTEGIEGYKASLLDSTFTEKSSVTGTITDATATYVLTADKTSVDEGSSVTYTVTSSLAAPAGGTTIPYTLTGNATLTTDYTGSSAATGNFTIAAGAKTGTLILSAVADNTTEATAENIIVTLGTPSSGNVTTGTVTTTVNDTSQGVAAGAVALSSSASSVNEGSAVTYTVTVGTAAPSGGLNIPYTLSGTSTRGTDYTGPSATTGNITIAAGATTGTLVATTVADTTTEGSETLIVTLGAMPSGYTLASGQGVVTTTINDTSLTIAGQTFTLTTGLDSIPGMNGSLGTTVTGGNDIILGDFTTTATLNAGDQVNGGDGLDTLKMYGTTAALVGTNMPISITNVETIVFGNQVDNAAFDLSTRTKAATGIANVQFDDVSLLAAKTITTTAGQSLSLATGTSGAVTAGTVTWAASATDASTSLALNGYQWVAGGTPAALTVTGAVSTTMNIASTGAANKVGTFTGPVSVNKHVVTGDKALTYALAAADAAALNSIDGSANTGGTLVDVSAALTKIGFAFTGGSGNDKLTVAAGQLATSALTSGTQFSFGAGTDTLVIKDTTPVYSTINAMTGLEAVQVAVTANSVDMSQLTPTAVVFGGFAVNAVSNLEATDSVTIAAAVTTSVTVGGAVGNSTGNINLGASATADGFTVASLVTTGLTNVNLTSNGNGTTANVLTAMTNSDNTNFTITGSNPLTMTVTAAATITGDRINAAGMTGVLTATGSNLADVIIGGSAPDTIKGLKGTDTLTGNGGADTFSFTGTAATGNLTAAGDFITITDFVVGTDKLQFSGVVDVVSAQQVAVQNAVTALAANSTSAQIANAMAGANTTNLGVSFAVYGGSTYVLYETTGATGTFTAADDIFIKLTGVATVPTFANDVIA